MDSSAAFGTATIRRGIPTDSTTGQVGPGCYDLPPTIRVGLPNYVGFGCTSKRSSLIKKEKIPAPGQYHRDQTKDLLKGALTSTPFKSVTKRFYSKDLKQLPGPGTYELPPAIEIKKNKKFIASAKTSYLESKLAENPAISLGTAVPPSIPNKFQSYGYEDAQDGSLVPQEPVRPGFTGLGRDTVGPGDYEPDVNFKFKKVPTAEFSKAPPRSIHLVDTEETPGPGYYEQPSAFIAGGAEAFHASPGERLSLSEFAERSRMSSTFLSSTERTYPKGREGPGPADYDIPTSIPPSLSRVPPAKQHLGSSSERFLDPTPASMRLATCPGAYNLITSDFDQARLKVLRKKRMAARSSWAQNIAFNATMPRFQEVDTGVPPPGSYSPKTSITDLLPQQNPRGGPFGGKAKRLFQLERLGEEMGRRRERSGSNYALEIRMT